MSTTLLTVTDSAQAKMKDALKQQGKETVAIRVRIDGATPTDFQVKLGFEKVIEKDDITVDHADLKVVIDPVSAENLKGATIDFLENDTQQGFKVTNPNKPDLGIPEPRKGLLDDPAAKKIHNVIQEKINPSVAEHGGIITLLDVKDSNVYIHMGGGCQGCASSKATLKQGVEQLLKESFPALKEIIDTTDHASGTNPYYKP